MQFLTSVNDECLYGIEGARQAYNTGKAPTDPNYIADNYAYMDFVLTTTIQSWCDMYVYNVQPLPAPPVIPVANITVSPYPVPVTFNGVPVTHNGIEVTHG